MKYFLYHQFKLHQFVEIYDKQRWSRGHKARGQGQGQKKSEAKAKDNPSEDRPSRGQGQECSRPRTQAQVFSKKKVFKIFFQAIYKILTIQKILLSSSRRQGNFRGLQASRPRTRPSRPKPRISKCLLEDSTFDDKININSGITW